MSAMRGESHSTSVVDTKRASEYVLLPHRHRMSEKFWKPVPWMVTIVYPLSGPVLGCTSGMVGVHSSARYDWQEVYPTTGWS